MKLHELELRGKDRYDYKDVGASLSWRSKEQLGPPDLTVKTNTPGIVLRVYNMETAYKIVVSDDGKPVGFIDFVRPANLAGKPAKKLAANTFTPHSGIKKSHTGRGIVSTIYRWFLDAGHNLITGHEQTEASNAMWKSLARHYDWMLVDKYGRKIENPTDEDGTDPTTRIVLFGKGQKQITETKAEMKQRDELKMASMSMQLEKMFGSTVHVFRAQAGNILVRLQWFEDKDDIDDELAATLLPKRVQKLADELYPGDRSSLSKVEKLQMSDGSTTLNIKIEQDPK